jgi:diadenosine tetraphosphatase ApaH/serine/threonine PP2A family protein phosphatase
MRLAVLSDIHANCEALTEVERRLESLRIDQVLFLGDAVGYNPDPEVCVRRISALAAAAVRGNHDKTVTDPANLDWFNHVARQALEWTRRTLTAEGRRLTAALPPGPVEACGPYLLCHGSPMDEDEYVTTGRAVQECFRFLAQRFSEAWICFCGHTHVPLIASEKGRASSPPERTALDKGVRYLINPGSVGQPRDRVPLASFGVLDDGELVYEHYRVPYPLEKTQAKILAAGLAPALAERLAVGW